MPTSEVSTATYAITARHVIDGEHVTYLEITDNQGKFRPIPIKEEKWVKSEATDLATFRTSLTGNDVPTMGINRLVKQQLGWPEEGVPALYGGMDVYTIGLFAKSPYRAGENGLRQTDAIFRFGKIARPQGSAPVFFSVRDVGDPNKAHSVPAILIESISFGGESGSPVFLAVEHTKDEPRDTDFGWPSSYTLISQPSSRSMGESELCWKYLMANHLLASVFWNCSREFQRTSDLEHHCNK